MSVEQKIAEMSPPHLLDPAQHQKGAESFIKYYHIRQKPPDLEFLRDILSHFARLPYENISKIIKLRQFFTSLNRLRLPEEIIEEHIQFGFGGTCFSLTFYLQCILLHYGYVCYPVMADMKNRPNEHCALVVLLDKRKYLVDPGYLLTTPMEIHPDKPRLYRAPHAGVELRFDATAERYHLRTFDKQNSTWRYCFQDKPVSGEEFLGFWLQSFYKGTMHGICLTRVRENGLIYLYDDFLQITSPDGKIKKKLKDDFFATIRDVFCIAPAYVEQALAAIVENKASEVRFGIFDPLTKTRHEAG